MIIVFIVPDVFLYIYVCLCLLLHDKICCVSYIANHK